MRRAYPRANVRIVVSCGAALILAILTLTTLVVLARAARASDSYGRAEIRPGSASHDVTAQPVAPLAKRREVIPSASGVAVQHLPEGSSELMNADDRQTADGDLVFITTVETGSGDGSTVFSGDLITYTFTLSNPKAAASTGVTISEILVFNPMSQNRLQELGCSPQDACGIKYITSTLVFTVGERRTTIVTSTEYITWATQILAPGLSTTLKFSGRVRCEPDGAIVQNRAFYAYTAGGRDKSGNSELTETRVVVQLEKEGQVNLSRWPTWCSVEPGGIEGLDWGDFDRDGDLDLVLGSGLFGTSVYRNSSNQLTRFWNVPGSPKSVHWADLDNDPQGLELIVVGDETKNFVYRYNASDDTFEESGIDNVARELDRIAVGDFDKDGDVDLVGSGGSGCQVRRYDNVGGTLAGPGECASENGFMPNRIAADYDNDGDLDIALTTIFTGISPYVFRNDGSGIFTELIGSRIVEVDADLRFGGIWGLGGFAYDMAWGDFDKDGFLDLVIALPFRFQVRIYRNVPSLVSPPRGFVLSQTIDTSDFALAVDWADFDGDGRLDLLVADNPPKIYRNTGSPTTPLTLSLEIAPELFDPVDLLWVIRGADYDDDGDLDLVLGSDGGAGLLFTAFSPFLDDSLFPIRTASYRANSVAWGDADADKDLDLLFGVGTPGAGGTAEFTSLLFKNVSGTLSEDRLFDGFGPRSVAWGDLNADGRLDIAFGTTGQNEVYLAGSTGSPDWTSSVAQPSPSIAWGDAWLDDVDGRLELLVGNEGAANLLYAFTQDGQLAALEKWRSGDALATQSVAWGDYNHDGYLDFAAGSFKQGDQVFCNNRDHTFSQAWRSPFLFDTRSVAWGDYDGDGDLDLAVGNYGGPNFIYENLTCPLSGCPVLPYFHLSCPPLSASPVWTMTSNAGTTLVSKTTSLAWGDWDNDGDLDLAVGNDKEPDQVYGNLGSAPGAPRLAWLWSSDERFRTTGLAWGDKDGDGDLDLAMSQNGAPGQVGFYENYYVLPMHLAQPSSMHAPLPDSPPYLSIEQPGSGDTGYFMSSAELLADPTSPTIAIDFTLFDPDVTPSGPTQDPIIRTAYEYSLDGGGMWHTATPSGPLTPSTVLTPSREGTKYRFLWNARQDQVVSDRVLFRITVFSRKRAGPVQRITSSATSPPFRVRALACYWPQNPSIRMVPSKPGLGTVVRFEGSIAAGSGVMTFTWDFGDYTPILNGQTVEHRLALNGTYTVTLTVVNRPCPVAREIVTHKTVVVGTAGPFYPRYLPVIAKSASFAINSATSGTLATAAPPNVISLLYPAQVVGLGGGSSPNSGAIHLEWEPNAELDRILGYQVYRSALEKQDFRVVASIPADVNTFTDETVTCGHAYYVTAFNLWGESLPSTASYYGLPCRE